MPAPEKEAVTIEPWAAGIGLATLALVAAVAIYTAWDRTRTSTIEQVTTPTAVGDTHFVQEPTSSAGPIGLKFEGRKLDMLSESKIRDSKLLRTATDDSGIYSIYHIEDEEGKKQRLFMKVGVNEFIEVTQE
jgi:hypothetical protein